MHVFTHYICLAADMLFLLQEYCIWCHIILLRGICKLLWANNLWWLVYDTIQRHPHLISCNIVGSLWAGRFFWNLPRGSIFFRNCRFEHINIRDTLHAHEPYCFILSIKLYTYCVPVWHESLGSGLLKSCTWVWFPGIVLGQSEYIWNILNLV